MAETGLGTPMTRAPEGVRRRSARSASLLALVVLGAAAPGSSRAAGRDVERVERVVGVMGTTLAVVIEADSRPLALAASERAIRAVEAVERRLSTWSSDSELARLNAAPVGEPFDLSVELAADLARVRELRRITGGAFDPGVGALVRAWGLRTGGRQPAPAEIAAWLAVGGLDALELVDRRAVRRSAELVIEEGAFGKGVGLDAALAALSLTARGEVHLVVLDLGGQVLVANGTHALSVADPRDRRRGVIRFEIGRGSVATSGNSERGIVVGGEPRSHVLDPRTGAPAADFGSMTVWAGDATTADALSTGLFVLGPVAGIALAERLPDVEALALEITTAGLVAHATSGLRGRIETLVDDLHVTTIDLSLESNDP